MKQWDRFKDIHWGVLAHSTHMRGARGPSTRRLAKRSSRINVTLATQIPPEVCEQIGVGYLNPASVDVDAVARGP